MPAQVSPCSGWLTPNETLRNLTSEVSLHEAARDRPRATDPLPLCPLPVAEGISLISQRQDVSPLFFFKGGGEDAETSVPILSNTSQALGESMVKLRNL